ncbi:MAG: hypothetical protein DMG22_21860 [Acidobacteria bacterium]|nr:MAG: hypothetical protein DMG43_06450 [Acidobacteriota bacterium]PYV29934.1 MAG: hypothetical protein DMG22_21860 [Acidobacteriota bacterium]
MTSRTNGLIDFLIVASFPTRPGKRAFAVFKRMLRSSLMKRNRLLLFSLILLCLSPYSHAQSWSGILDPKRAIDWSGAGVTGGIPNRTTICSTLNPGATTAQIQSALNSCPSGQVVFLNSGNYGLNSGLTVPSNVTLRGAGANLTTLTFTGSSSYYWGSYLIGFSGNYNGSADNGSPPGPGGSLNCSGSPGPPSTYTGCTQLRSWVGTNGLTGVYTKGATILNLSSAPAGLNVGDMLQLVQTDDQAVASTGPFVCSLSSAGCSREGEGLSYHDTAMRQNVKVVAINGSAVTVSPGIYADFWLSSKNPVAYWWGGDTRMAGVENLTATTGLGVWAGLLSHEASDCWFSGVALHVGNGSRQGFLIHLSRNITIQNSFLDVMAGGGFGSTTSYGITNIASSATLVQNNILKNVESPILTAGGYAGDVYAYNYDPGICTPSTGCTGIFTGHDVGGMFILLEGNIGPQIRPDTYHGNALFWTIFRNRLTATEQNMNQEAAIDLLAFSRYYNVIGNVLGTSGNSNNYECSNSATSNCGRFSPNIFRLGYPGENATTGSEAGVNPDGQVKATLMRWGNYDVVSAVNRFISSEVPTGLSQYANPLPASQILPPSLYLLLKPSWWPASKPWPAIGPDVAGGNISGLGGHAYMIPSQDCYTSISGNMTSFNAATCYASGTASAPAPPTGLQAVVQ